MSTAAQNKLWGGRFAGKADPLFEEFNASIGFDKNLWAADIKGEREAWVWMIMVMPWWCGSFDVHFLCVGSQAYARALGRAGVITESEAKSLVVGLDAVAA